MNATMNFDRGCARLVLQIQMLKIQRSANGEIVFKLIDGHRACQ